MDTNTLNTKYLLAKSWLYVLSKETVKKES